MLSFPPPAPLEIYLLGLIEFEDAQRLQRRLAYELGESPRGGALILCEHPPTITVGRSGSRAHILPDNDELRHAAIRVHWVNRGGGCVLHVPGQLVAYLMLPLDHHAGHLGRFLDGLHRVILDVLREFDLRGRLDPATPGVFIDRARIATVGVSVNRWITGFGTTLNVGTYLRSFDLLEEPGLNGYLLRQTSMESRRQRPAPMNRVKETLIHRLESVFGLERHHVFTDHPLIARKANPHAHIPLLG